MGKNNANNHSRYGEMLRRTLVTALSGGLAFYITNLSNQPVIWGLTISIIISGFTLAIQFINDFDNRLLSFAKKLDDFTEGHPAHIKEIQSLIEEGFARTNEVAELFRAVEKSPLRTDVITRLVQHSAQIEPCSPPLVTEFAHSQINRTSQFLKELSDGGVVPHDGEDKEWLLELTMQSQHTIDATSLCTVDAGAAGFHGGLWTSDFGQHYLELQRQAIHRGVHIRRVFILDGSAQPDDPDFLDIYRQQRDLGIHTRVLERQMIPHPLKNVLYDFIVFDHALSYEVTPASRVEDNMGPTIVKTHLTLQPQRIQGRIRRFEELWSCARELDAQELDVPPGSER